MAEANSPVTWSHLEWSEPVTKGQNKGIKMENQKGLKFWTPGSQTVKCLNAAYSHDVKQYKKYKTLQSPATFQIQFPALNN